MIITKERIIQFFQGSLLCGKEADEIYRYLQENPEMDQYLV